MLHSSSSPYLGDNLANSNTVVLPSLLGKNAPTSSAPIVPYGSGELLNTYAGGGGWASTASDLVRIVSAFDLFKWGSSSSKGMTDIEGKTIMKHDTVQAMWNSPPVSVKNRPYRLGWYSFFEDPVGFLSPDGPPMTTQVRWHKGDWQGMHSAMAWRSDHKCFAYTLSRGPSVPIDDEGAIGLPLFTIINDYLRSK